MNLPSMLTNHPFWGVLTLAVLVWYSTITVYVSIRGASDIKHMLRKLKTDHESAGAAEPGGRGDAGTKS